MRVTRFHYLLTGYLALSCPFAARSEQTPRITVMVCDYTRAKDPAIHKAISGTQAILRQAGIRSQWILGPHGKLDHRILTLQIFDGSAHSTRLPQASGVALQAEDGPSFLADIFYGTIRSQAPDDQDASVLMAHVMAHELGHLLGLSHSDASIMAAHWTKTEMYSMRAAQLRFTRSEANQLKAAAARWGSR